MLSLIRQEHEILDEVVPLGLVDSLAVSIETLLLENSLWLTKLSIFFKSQNLSIFFLSVFYKKFVYILVYIYNKKLKGKKDIPPFFVNI